MLFMVILKTNKADIGGISIISQHTLVYSIFIDVP